MKQEGRDKSRPYIKSAGRATTEGRPYISNGLNTENEGGRGSKTRRAGAPPRSACPRERRCGCCLLAPDAPLVVDHVPGLFLRDRGPDQRHHAGPRAPVLDHRARISHECRSEAAETEARRGFSEVRTTQAYPAVRRGGRARKAAPGERIGRRSRRSWLVRAGTSRRRSGSYGLCIREVPRRCDNKGVPVSPCS